MTLLLVSCALLLASVVQSATGFGFALIAGPSLFALIDPVAAIALILVLGQVVNVLVLFAEQRRPVVDWPAVRTAILAAVPGMPIGALIVRAVSISALRVAVGAIVCAAIGYRIAQARRNAAPGVPGRVAGVVAGFAVGILTTSTTTSGPPLAIWLTARRLSPAEIRDTVTAIFALLDVFGLAIFVPVVGVHASLEHAVWLWVLVPVACVGHLAGRQLFRRLPGGHYDRIVLAIALIAGVASAISGLL